MISLILSRVPLVALSFGFTNILAIPVLRSFGMVPAYVFSALLTFSLFTGSVAYYLYRGLQFREVVETKFGASSTSAAVSLIGLVFLVVGIVIMFTARDVQDAKPEQMTRVEQVFFGSIPVFLGAGTLMVPYPGLFTSGVDDGWNYCVIFCV